ncbi:MAG: hypothetical protein ACTSV5_07060 [Promethearchaeota archaeon]
MDAKKIKFKWYLIGSVIFIGTIFTLLYIIFWATISYSLTQLSDTMLSIFASLIRIVVLGIMSLLLFIKWFKQEAIYTSDAYFLFALFFMILTCGKILDLHYNLLLVSELLDDAFLLVFLKIRFFLIIFTLLPVLFIGLQAIMTLTSAYIKEMSDSRFNKIRSGILFIFAVFFSIIIILANSISALITVLPFFTFLIYIALGIMFLFMYKNKHLSQANGLIIGIGFFAFVISNIFRAIMSVYALDTPSIFFIIEGVDICVNFLMFIGFIKKPKYAI